jgi:hypothetical protein
MLTKVTNVEWMVEPWEPEAREYARLSITATREGINIDGQGTLPWASLLDAFDKIEKDEEAFEKKRRKR